MIKWKQTNRFEAVSNEGHKLLKTLPHSPEPIYNVFDKDDKYLGSTRDRAAVNKLIIGE